MNTAQVQILCEYFISCLLFMNKGTRRVRGHGGEGRGGSYFSTFCLTVHDLWGRANERWRKMAASYYDTEEDSGLSFPSKQVLLYMQPME